MTLTVPIPELTPSQTSNFWAKVNPTGLCWEWNAQKTRDGYGQFNTNRSGRKFGAHRIAYTLLLGEIPKGLELDHLCRNTSCVNPDHLEPVTRKENQLRVPEPARPRVSHRPGFLPPWVTTGRNVTGYCSRGHEYTESNTYTYKDGRTECRDCKKINRARYRAKKASAVTA